MFADKQIPVTRNYHGASSPTIVAHSHRTCFEGILAKYNWWICKIIGCYREMVALGTFIRGSVNSNDYDRWIIETRWNIAGNEINGRKVLRFIDDAEDLSAMISNSGSVIMWRWVNFLLLLFFFRRNERLRFSPVYFFLYLVNLARTTLTIVSTSRRNHTENSSICQLTVNRINRSF